ncbi:Golgi-associated plant pathogenesis-related protein 1-like [Folsomia candida]|uniref:Golgi-associated plant pathogenesis-related protein 1-like n=1 Tax=Folsomia candida TaxID=158441 RepID=UPI001604EE09|nr:Golgi-associated plant pathogenesis-related protein 1-like [Folsomia candida]
MIRDSHQLCVIFSNAFSEFQTTILNEVNRLRAFHGSPPMVLDEKLSQGCQEYAESLRASVKPGEWFSHSAGAGADYGETMTGPNNWAWIRSVNFGQWLVDEMYGEIKNYDWAKPDFQVGPNGQVVGHFATLVWKSSTNLGVGVADPTGHETNGAVVIRTTPAGFYDHLVAENVPQLLPPYTKDSYKNTVIRKFKKF